MINKRAQVDRGVARPLSFNSRVNVFAHEEAAVLTSYESKWFSVFVEIFRYLMHLYVFAFFDRDRDSFHVLLAIQNASLFGRMNQSSNTTDIPCKYAIRPFTCSQHCSRNRSRYSNLRPGSFRMCEC